MPETYYKSRYQYIQSKSLAGYQIQAKQLFGLLKKEGIPYPKSVLDLGCGKGDFVRTINSLFGSSIAGIDQDEGMIQMAQNKNSGVYHVGNILEPHPELKNKFDLVMAFEVFEHLGKSDHRKALNMFQYYARESGIGFILVPNAAHPLLGPWVSYSDYTHESHFTPESLIQMVRHNQLEPIKVYPFYFGRNSAQIYLRKIIGWILEKTFKLSCFFYSSIPKSSDPSVFEPIHFSSHIGVMFKL